MSRGGSAEETRRAGDDDFADRHLVREAVAVFAIVAMSVIAALLL
jgi:hypothetical protein